MDGVQHVMHNAVSTLGLRAAAVCGPVKKSAPKKIEAVLTVNGFVERGSARIRPL